MRRFSRRQMVGSMVIGGSSLVMKDFLDIGSANATKRGEEMQGQTPGSATPARAFGGQHQPKPLTFNPAKLTGLSEKLIRSHWENNYGGAVKALNAVEQRLQSLLRDPDLPAYIYGLLKREELVRTGSIVLHELYFGNLGGDGRAGGKVLDLIKHWFGSYEQWEAEFKKTANALAGGSGWVVLAHNIHTGEVHNYWAWDHMHNAPMSRPLLVLDMYEHAYHMDFGAATAKYVDAFVQNVDWEEVNRRAEASFKASVA